MKKNRISVIILVSLLLINMTFINSETNENKISSDVYKNLEKNDEVRVIVELKEPNPEKGFIIKSKKSDYEIETEKEEIKDEIKQDVGENNIKHEFDNKISLEVSLDDLKKLNENTNVETVSLVGKMYAFLQESVPLINATKTWPLQILGINLTGIKDTVCIIDTGVNFNHPDLIGKNKTCVIDCIGKACVENCAIGDDHGHGTHVAGIVGANGTIKGVGIGVSLIGVKVLNAAGGGNTDDVYAGIDWCVDNSATYNISVISMSLGDCTNHSTYCNNDGSATHINAAVAKNISVVIAAGNGPGVTCPLPGLTNVDGPSAPACVENATAIGAVSKSDVITYQRGNLFEIMAPGVSINSTKSTGGYELRSGTSMATPHAAGAFAIIRQAFRLMNNRIPTPLEIRNILNSTGKIINDSGGTNLNFSRINIYAAVISLDNISPNVNLKSPLNNHINMSQNYTFFCNYSDWQLANVSFYLWNSSSYLIYNETKNVSGTFNESNFNVNNLSYKDYKWNCQVSDLNGNYGFASSNFTLIVGGIKTNLSSPMNSTYTNLNFSNFTCGLNSGEESRLKNASFYLWNSSSYLIYNETKNVSGTLNSSIFNYTFINEGNYSWNCLGVNNQSNSSFGDNNYSIVYDKTNPILSSLISSPGTTYVTIDFTTNENSNVSINYGIDLNITGNYSNSNFSTAHSHLISSLSSSTVYYYNITYCDNAKNCIINGTFSFTTNAEPVYTPSSEGGGGGGGGGVVLKTYVLNEEQFSGGRVEQLNKNEKIKFTFDKVDHTITLNEITTDSVNITLRSEPINLLLKIGQSIKLNLTNKEYYELYVKLVSIEDKKANISIQKIYEKIKIENNNKIIANNEIEKEIPKEENNILKEEKDNLIIKILISILLIGFLGFMVFIVFIIIKRMKKENIEKVKKDHKEIFNKHLNPKNKGKVSKIK